MTKHYSDVADLAAVYLEDSFVLDIVKEPGQIKFRVEAVLTEQHPQYSAPKSGEQYCYADAWLTFPDVSDIEWQQRSAQAFTDASDEEDLGNIDYLERDGEHWSIGGDWGEAHIHTNVDPVLTIGNL
ncbi:hypothetical protein [Saccharopolyspora gloriosae]|uniref:hypothetical protein n=1 Tax=Saccharopolyspora gloriosae TaxID=455344 RepID=UPI001FB69C72|nr:hypothetical protein [Saccharopolyspora gloriosae]